MARPVAIDWSSVPWDFARPRGIFPRCPVVAGNRGDAIIA
jgi:hypothetical protein